MAIQLSSQHELLWIMKQLLLNYNNIGTKTSICNMNMTHNIPTIYNKSFFSNVELTI